MPRSVVTYNLADWCIAWALFQALREKCSVLEDDVQALNDKLEQVQDAVAQKDSYIAVRDVDFIVFMCNSVLAIAKLSFCPFVHLSVTWVDQSKMVRARITKSSPSAAWKTLVSGSVKFFHKFERDHSKRGC